MILKFGKAINMIAESTLFIKRLSHLVSYEFGPSKTCVDYYTVTRDLSLSISHWHTVLR